MPGIRTAQKDKKDNIFRTLGFCSFAMEMYLVKNYMFSDLRQISV